MNDRLAKLVTEASLARLAGERSFARGRAYVENGAVLDLVQTRDGLKARVLGSDEYRVVLRPEGRDLDWSCTCPLGDELEHAHSYLASQSKETLIELLLEQAGDDPELRARLDAAALQHDPPTDLKALKETVRRALAVPGGFVDYRGMRAFVARAGAAAELLRRLLGSGRAADAATLADYAMRRGIAAYARTDDSAGAFGDTLRRLAALHLQACRRAKPEGQSLGAALFELQMLDEWGFFDFEDYAPLLGEKGVARYRALAEKAWREVPVLQPGARGEPESGRYLIARIMETLARHDGNPDAVIAVKSRDLSHPHAFLEIAQILAEARRHDEALAWAERGHGAFPNPDPRLVDFIIQAYHRAKRHDDAAALAWQYFSRHPDLTSYRHLKKSAGRANSWQAWREKALARVRAAAPRTSGSSSPRRARKSTPTTRSPSTRRASIRSLTARTTRPTTPPRRSSVQSGR